MLVGQSGNGTLNISDGATSTAWSITLGKNAGSVGVVNVKGGILSLEDNGSPSTGYDFALIGAHGEGAMYVTQGGKVNDHYILLGEEGGRGTLVVSGAGSALSSSSHTVAGLKNGGVGYITVIDGGTLNAGVTGTAPDGESLVLGEVAGSAGDLLVTGQGSVVNAGTETTVAGKSGSGNITLQNDGRLNTGELVIAQQAGSAGVVNIGSASGSAATAAGTLSPDAVVSFGSGEGTLNFNHTDSNYVFANLIQGNGTVDINSGTTVLTAENTWSGNTRVNGGVLKAGAQNTFSPDASYNVASAGTLNLNGFSQTIGDLSNAGTVNLAGTQPGTTLTIDGNYTSLEGSSVWLGTVLGGDDSLTDRLDITGNTAGSSTLNIANKNGSGAQTLEGIKVVEVGGSSDGTFTLGNRVVAGAYDYSLQKGSESGADAGDWYLTSVLNNPDPDNPDTPDDHAVRPEAGSYISNLQATRTLFNLSLHDREGETRYTDPVTGESRTTSMWMRNEGGRNAARLADGQNRTTANRYVLQIGGDLLSRETEGAGKMTLGVMGGYADQSSSTHNSATGNTSKGNVHGYSAGLYGTWYQNPADQSGLYVDSWLQYGWFDNEVKGDDLSPETYKSKGLSASLEAGYGLKIATLTSSRGMENSIWLQPHAQVIWTGMKADGHTESNGTRVEGTGNDNVQTKLGLRAFLNGKSVKDKDTVREFQPFVEANWIYNTQTTGVRMNGEGDTVSSTRNAGEVKAGLEGRLSQGLSVWTAVAQQVGDKGYHDTAGSLGVRYRF